MLTDKSTAESLSSQKSVQIAAQETLIANLRNAHALEKQVIAVLEPQLKLFDNYPVLHGKVTQHISETREQAHRLEAVLDSCGSSTSMVKDALLSVMGLGQSSIQGFSSDAVLKAIVADMMTEHLEIATYRMLIVLAKQAGRADLCPALEQSLQEERAMADWFDENLEQLTQRFIALEAEKKRRDATADQADASSDGPGSHNPDVATTGASRMLDKTDTPESSDQDGSSPETKFGPTLKATLTSDTLVDSDMKRPLSFDNASSDFYPFENGELPARLGATSEIKISSRVETFDLFGRN